MNDPVITYDYDSEYSSIEIFVDLKLVCTWVCEGDPKEVVKEFESILDFGVRLGRESLKKEISQL